MSKHRVKNFNAYDWDSESDDDDLPSDTRYSNPQFGKYYGQKGNKNDVTLREVGSTSTTTKSKIPGSKSKSKNDSSSTTASSSTSQNGRRRHNSASINTVQRPEQITNQFYTTFQEDHDQIASARDQIDSQTIGMTVPKPKLHMVVAGHVDAGKSTLMGHLLVKSGVVDDTLFKSYQHKSHQIGKGSFSYAWVMDTNEEERTRGVTMDIGFANFETAHRSITILDSPGHSDFVPQMITGAGNADCAILVVPANYDEFESSFHKHGQTKEHALLLRSLGISQLIVALNKMDLVQWSETRFIEVANEMAGYLKSLGFKKSQYSFIPISAQSGENLTTRQAPSLCSWWPKNSKDTLDQKANRTSPQHTPGTLLDKIDRFRPILEENFGTILNMPKWKKSFRMAISDVCKPRVGQRGDIVVTGKIISGFVHQEDCVLIMPSGVICQVLKVEKPIGISNSGKFYDDDGLAIAGDNAEVTLVTPKHALLKTIDSPTTTISTSDELSSSLRPGDSLCDPANPIPYTTRFIAQMMVFSTIQYPITKGFEGVFHSSSGAEPGHVSKLFAILNLKSKRSKVKQKHPRLLPRGSVGEVEIKLTRPLCLEIHTKYPSLGRFLLRDRGVTVAAGLVTKIISD